MSFSLGDPFLALIFEMKNTQTCSKVSITNSYALAIKKAIINDKLWGTINESIIERWGIETLKRIKDISWYMQDNPDYHPEEKDFDEDSPLKFTEE